jgi:hypothetical protein
VSHNSLRYFPANTCNKSQKYKHTKFTIKAMSRHVAYTAHSFVLNYLNTFSNIKSKEIISFWIHEFENILVSIRSRTKLWAADLINSFWFALFALVPLLKIFCIEFLRREDVKCQIHNDENVFDVAKALHHTSWFFFKVFFLWFGFFVHKIAIINITA